MPESLDRIDDFQDCLGDFDLEAKIDATMSARRPGSSMFSMTIITSGIKTLPRLTIRSICSLTVRMAASVSRAALAGLCSVSLSMRTE